MARFTFRLDPVLAHRTRIETEKQGLLAVAQRDLAIAVERLEATQRSYDGICADLRGAHGEFDVNELANMYAHLDYLARTIIQLEARVSACMFEVNRARVSLVSATRDKKVIEKLRERKRDAFATEQLAAEQRGLDDGNARRYCVTLLGEESTS